jgi:mycothiol synthase
MHVQRFAPQDLSDRELAEIHRFTRRIQAEREPDHAPSSYEGFAANIRNVPSYVTLEMWVVRAQDAGDVIARANLVLPVTTENQHVGHFDLMVLPEFRRQGIGTELLGLVASAAQGAGRRLLTTSSTSTVPAADAFLRRIGADPSLAGHINVLQLGDVDRELMRFWQERVPERAPDYLMGVWEGRYPEDRLDDVCAMFEAFNTMPMGDLDLEESHYTPQQVRELDSANEARGITRWTVYVEHKVSGAIAGFTEVFIDHERPEQANQGLTAVFPDHRNRGLGRWLKAAAVEKLLAEYPQCVTVKTSNADVNEAMLNINREMGFKPVAAEMMWQVPVERVHAYTAQRPHTLVLP